MSDLPEPESKQRSASQERREREEAFQRGRETAMIEARLNGHDARLDAINGSIDRTGNELRSVGEKLSRLDDAFRQSVAVAAARADDAKKDAEKQVSTRTFILGLIGAVAAIGLLLVSAGHF